MSEELDKIFDDSELCYQVKKYFDGETATKMIEELKTDILKLINHE